MTLTIESIKLIRKATPSQWEGVLTDGRGVSIMYSHGVLSATVDSDEINPNPLQETWVIGDKDSHQMKHHEMAMLVADFLAMPSDDKIKGEISLRHFDYLAGSIDIHKRAVVDIDDELRKILEHQPELIAVLHPIAQRIIQWFDELKPHVDNYAKGMVSTDGK